jgi:hypothetical protein
MMLARRIAAAPGPKVYGTADHANDTRPIFTALAKNCDRFFS